MANSTWWPGPTLLAALVTLLNALKPAVVDDTAYLLFARHLATDPLDPYGFEHFWYRQPEPAMQVLLPPVVPYWLALGIALTGETLIILKLWLFPFLLLFCHASARLLHRLAPGVERPALVLLAGSPFVLPFVNVMLDLPAIGLGLTAVLAFRWAGKRGSWRGAVAAGVLMALAAQTKYTMVVLPGVIVWSAILQRAWGLAALAVGVAAGLFVGWELLLVQAYGKSHFVVHLHDQQTARGLTAWVSEKSALWRPLLGYLGGLAGAWGLIAARVCGWPGRLVAGLGVAVACGYLAVCLTPIPEDRSKPFVDVPAIVFYSFGAVVLTAVGHAVAILLLRCRRGAAGWFRLDRLSLFLVGWIAIELAAYVILTPFPAGRRVLGVCVVTALLTARLWSLIRRARPDRRVGRWILVFGIGSSLGLFALDWWDSLAEKELVDDVAAIIPADTGAIWTQGHWGWQYYTDRRGWQLVAPGRSRLRERDWLVVPTPSEPAEFYRPHHGYATFEMPAEVVEPVGVAVWEDRLPARTIPTLYGGAVPVIGRDGPRLRVVVYRVRRDWIPAPTVDD